MEIYNNNYLKVQGPTAEPSSVVVKTSFQSASTITQNAGAADTESCWSSFKNKVSEIWNKFVSWISSLCSKEKTDESQETKPEEKKSDGRASPVNGRGSPAPINNREMRTTLINADSETLDVVIEKTADVHGDMHFKMTSIGQNEAIGFMKLIVDNDERCVYLQDAIYPSNSFKFSIISELTRIACDYSESVGMLGVVKSFVTSDHQSYYDCGFDTDERQQKYEGIEQVNVVLKVYRHDLENLSFPPDIKYRVREILADYHYMNVDEITDEFIEQNWWWDGHFPTIDPQGNGENGYVLMYTYARHDNEA